MAKYAVSLRGGFSDRNKIKIENTTIQTNKLDTRTRVALINATDIVISLAKVYSYSGGDFEQKLLKGILSDVYSQPVKWNGYYDEKKVFSIVNETITTDTYDAVLTIVEYIAKFVDEAIPYGFEMGNKRCTAASCYNQVFEREYVGYRFVHGEIVRITNPTEIKAIEDAAANKYIEVQQHIEKALRFLSDRESPDYENSIKESISAVERMCSIVIGKRATLGEALKKLEDAGVVIHPALKAAFNTLYGYTSDASGIRHAGQLGGANSTFDEAKFMLVSCCAFVNYLTGVMAKQP